jgi:hypothetical protein
MLASGYQQYCNNEPPSTPNTVQQRSGNYHLENSAKQLIQGRLLWQSPGEWATMVAAMPSGIKIIDGSKNMYYAGFADADGSHITGSMRHGTKFSYNYRTTSLSGWLHACCLYLSCFFCSVANSA